MANELENTNRRQNQLDPNVDWVAPPENEEPVLSIEERLAQIANAEDLQNGRNDPDEIAFRRQANTDHLLEDANANRGNIAWQQPLRQIGGQQPENNAPQRRLNGRRQTQDVAIRQPDNALQNNGNRNVAGQMPNIQLDWVSLFGLPGYMGMHGDRELRQMVNRMGGEDFLGDQIRTLGRAIFRNFPCFAEMTRISRQQERDPLGDVQVLANINGQGPHNSNQINQMANWIRENGQIRDANQMEMPNIMRGYRPELILATNEDTSFLLVRETRRNGAPVDATYIYTWAGGNRFYNNANTLGNNGQNQNIAGRQQNHQIAHEQNVGQPNFNQRRQNDYAENNMQTTQMRNENTMQQPVNTVNPIKLLKSDGFKVQATEFGPGFVKTEDGITIVITGVDISISMANEFRVQLKDENQNEISNSIISDVTKYNEIIDSYFSGGPKI